MYLLNRQIKKIIHDQTGYYFSFERPDNHQYVYQTINESAFFIMKNLAEGIDSINLLQKLKKKYPTDTNVEAKTNLFLNQLINVNLLSNTYTQKVYYKPIIIESTTKVIPRYCILEISSNCLLNCSHCYLGVKNNQYMGEDTLVNLIDELYFLGIDYIQLTGGEPLLHPSLEKVLDKIHSKNLKLLITSSGYIKTDENEILTKISYFKNNCLLQVSIDGLEQTHNKIRGKDDCFNKSITFIKKALSYGIETHIATVVQKNNYKELEDIVCFMKKLGVKTVRFSGIMEEGFAKQEDIVLNDIICKTVYQLSQKYKSPSFDVITLEDSINAVKNRKTPNCGCGSHMITIDANLNVYSCVLYRHPLFNLNKLNLSDGLDKYSYQNYCVEAPNEDDCKDCKQINFCKGCITNGLLQHNKTACKWGQKWKL